jgi:hypothetical protein
MGLQIEPKGGPHLKNFPHEQEKGQNVSPWNMALTCGTVLNWRVPLNLKSAEPRDRVGLEFLRARYESVTRQRCLMLRHFLQRDVERPPLAF